MADSEILDWLYRIGYPFDVSWPDGPPPVDHRRLAAIWNERGEWGVTDEDAYLTVCAEAGIEPGRSSEPPGAEARETWWVLRSDDFGRALARAHNGEDPAALYIEFYANSRIEQEGGQS